MTIVIVTGTNTGVGKTVATAALLGLIAAAGPTTAMVKPVQTGTSGGEPRDADTVARLSGRADVAEISTLADPLAPDSAARLRGVEIPTVAELAARTAGRFASCDVLIVEGAGGVLVRLDTEGGTLLDLAAELDSAGHRVVFVVVTTVALGTLNHTELTVAAVQQRGFDIAGLVVGLVPTQLDLAAERNLVDLSRVTAMPILARLPEGAGGLPPTQFQASCAGWFTPEARDYFTGMPTAADSTAST